MLISSIEQSILTEETLANLKILIIYIYKAVHKICQCLYGILFSIHTMKFHLLLTHMCKHWVDNYLQCTENFDY